jgi:hypothetical protein
MHPAYLSASAINDVDAAALEQPEGEQPSFDGFELVATPFDVVVATLATDGDFDLPPQPAASRARLASPAASTTPRRARHRRFTPRRQAEPSKTALTSLGCRG